MGEIEVRDAATVMLVRDGIGDGGAAATGESVLEVFMLRRNLNSDFVGGAYVFPGGAVDLADRHADLEAVCEGRSDDQASALLGVESGGLAYWVAAIRECFEEAGVLLAIDGDGEVISFADATMADRFERYRGEVYAGEARLVEICRDEGLRLDVAGIHYFAHWITPEGQPRRYDTRFFVAAAPPRQRPLHDDNETIASLWIRPADALARHQAGELQLILPTIRNLEAISRFATSADLLTAAAAIQEVPTIVPRIVDDGGGMRILLPGDAGYDQALAGG